jgi:hypothetical protein
MHKASIGELLALKDFFAVVSSPYSLLMLSRGEHGPIAAHDVGSKKGVDSYHEPFHDPQSMR